MNKVHELIRAKEHSVTCVRKDVPVTDTAQLFLDKDISSLLVCEDSRVVGIFTKNDLVRRCTGATTNLGDLNVAQCMSTELYTTTPDTDLEDVFGEMVERGIRHVPVLDGEKPIGMITPIDILNHKGNILQSENEALVRYIRGSY